MKPSLIVCDEPVAALDVSVRAQVLNLLRDLQEELGLAYLFVCHDLALVEVIADRVMVMASGEVVETGSTDQIFANPRQEYTRRSCSRRSPCRCHATRRATGSSRRERWAER